MRRLLAIMGRAAGSQEAGWRRSVRLVAVAAALQAVAFLLLLPVLAALVDGEVARSRWLLAGLVAVLGIESVLRLAASDFEYRVFPRLVAELRLRIGTALRTMPAEELSRRRTGDVAVLLGTDVMNATLAIGEIAAVFLRLVVVPAAVLAGLALVDWRVAVAVAAGAAVAAPGLAALRRRSAEDASGSGQADVDAASRVVEYVQALPVLKAAGQVGERSQRLTAALEEQGRRLNASQTSVTGPALVVALGAEVGVAAMIAVAVWLTLGEAMALATLVGVVVVAARFAETVTLAQAMTAIFELADHGLTRIDDLLAVDPLPVPDDPTPIRAHHLAFDRVAFTYQDADQPALDEVSFTSSAGLLTALVGPSGGGKSTVLRLLTRWADPQAGAVRIGGVDLREVDPRELMRHLAIVHQDLYLFDTTIAGNVAMARPDASDDEVAGALHAANCGPLLSRLPDGLHTPVGEIGGRLSGGERQRIAIARALLKDAPIVLLDEPTAALDADSEVALQTAVDRLVAERTVLIIAHRLSTVVAADQILVLDDGHIVERGDHTALLDAGGRYAAMWDAQTAARHWKVPT